MEPAGRIGVFVRDPSIRWGAGYCNKPLIARSDGSSTGGNRRSIWEEQDVRHRESIRLAGRTLNQTNHICAFFNSREEQNEIMMPFFKEGLDRGEKAFQVIDQRMHEQHLCDCRNAGINADAAIQSGQLEIRHWEDAYLKDGYFDGERMMRILREVLEGNREKYGLTRLMGNMEWALETVPGVTDIIEYETRLNYVLPEYPDPVVCVYDLNKHNGSAVIDILRTHPMVIIGGNLQENPLYVPPDEFLRELAHRKRERQSLQH